MKTRSYSIRLKITIDKTSKWYTVSPLAVNLLPNPFVHGFTLIGISDTPAPVYRVMLAVDGVVNCTCPQWNRGEKCKHAEALTAAGLLPVTFVKLLRDRTALLDQAEAELAKLTQQAIEEQLVYQHDSREMQERITDLEGELRAVEQRAQQLQTGLAAAQASKPRRSRKKVAA